MTTVNEFMHDAIPARQPEIAVPNVDGERLMVRSGQSGPYAGRCWSVDHAGIKCF